MHHEAVAVANVFLNPDIACETLLTPEMFDDYECRKIYAAALAVIDKGIKPDPISVRDFDASINPGLLVKILSSSPSTANWRYYENAIVGEWKRRKLSTLGKRLIESTENHDQLLQIIEESLSEISYATGRKNITAAKDHVLDYINELEYRYNHKGELRGLSTGIDNLDTLLNGLKPRLLYLVGGRPSDGKSALGLNIASHVAIRERRPVGIISIESATMELIDRLCASESHIDSRKLETGFYSKGDFDRIIDIGKKLSDAPLYFYDTPNAKLSDITSIARTMRRTRKIELLVFDYIQLAKVQGAKTKIESTMETSTTMKSLARELEIPIVALAQLNRDSQDRRPDIADFQWSSQIEQDADAAILLYHKYIGDGEHREIDRSFLLVDKCRNGKRGVADVVFRKEYVKFEAYHDESRIRHD